VSNRQHSLVIRYINGHENRIVLPDEDDEAHGYTNLAEWIDTNTALVEVDDRTLLLLEQEDRVLTIPFQDIKNIEFATRAPKLTH
jgi:hypothetical protein